MCRLVVGMPVLLVGGQGVGGVGGGGEERGGGNREAPISVETPHNLWFPSVAWNAELLF